MDFKKDEIALSDIMLSIGQAMSYLATANCHLLSAKKNWSKLDQKEVVEKINKAEKILANQEDIILKLSKWIS